MRKQFSGFYTPTDEEYKKLWEEGLIILDTNILLNLYRLPATARDEMVAVLDKISARLWIPHQVGLEFQRARLSVISNERKSFEAALTSTSNFVDQVRQKVNALELDKRDLAIDSKNLIDELEKANKQISDAISRAHKGQLDVSSSDPIRNNIDRFLSGHVGQGPKDQAELDELIKDGDIRYLEKIPPGYMDADKAKNPADATFTFDSIKYQRKFGDLILWRQLLEHVKSKNLKTVLLITSDKKEDWWWQEQGKTLGPQPELVREIEREAGVELFWMYSAPQFLELSKKYLNAEVSAQSVVELKQVGESIDLIEIPDQLNNNEFFDFHNEIEDLRIKSRAVTRSFGGGNIRNAFHAVLKWLDKPGYEIIQSDYPPFFIRVKDCFLEDLIDGYDVIFLSRINPHFVEQVLSEFYSRTVGTRYKEDLSTLNLILIFPSNRNELLGDNFVNFDTRFGKSLRRIMPSLSLERIISGMIVEGEFRLINDQRRQY